MTYDPAMDGPGPRRSDEGVVPAWPVLARLPWVGEEEHAQPSFVHDDAYATPEHRRPSPPPLRIADEPREPTSRRQYRIDPGVSGISSPPSPMRVVAPRDEVESLAGRIYQWHAALAPYAGVAVTFVLALFAGLLYWSTFGRQGEPTIDMTAVPQWQGDANVVAPATAPTWAQSFDLPESPLSQTPEVRLNIPSIGIASQAAPSTEENVHAEVEPPAAAPSSDVQPLEETAVPSGEAGEPAVASAPSVETAATPQSSPVAGPLRITYPTTPFASFDFGPTAAPSAPAGDAPAPAAAR